MERRRTTSDPRAAGRSRHAATFSDLYDRHAPAIRSYCSRRVRRQDVDDAVSEVFAVAWRRIDDVPDDGTELYWLYGVARNAIRNLDRSGRRRSRLVERLRSLGRSTEETPEVQLVRSEEIRGVLTALSRLRASDQEVLRLRMWEELDRHEVAEVFGISPAAADMRINRAVRRMAAELRRTGVAEHFESTARDEQGGTA